MEEILWRRATGVECVGGTLCRRFGCRLAAANEATKYMRIKISRGLKWPQNDVKKHNNQLKARGIDAG